MEKTLLIFVPGAHPTYIPLGVASLYSYIKKRLPGSSISVMDLNILLWNSIFESGDHVSLAPAFFRGGIGDFYSREMYTAYMGELSLFYSEYRRIEHELKKFLDTGETNEKTDYYRSFILNKLNITGNETIALSAMYPDQLVHMLSIAAIIKKEFPDVTIIAGGAALTAVDIDELMDAAPFISLFYRGEGEEGLYNLLSGAKHESIRGLSVRHGGNNTHNPSPQAIELRKLPVPDFSFCNFKDYLTPEPVLPVVFSRGCRWRRCSFCSHNFSFAGYRTSDYLAFTEKLAYHHVTSGVSQFYFADQYIGADDLFNISKTILESGLNIRFHVMGRPTGDYTSEILQCAFDAGCRWISWGVESGSSELLNICSKGTEPEVIEKVLRISSEAGISNLAMMIFGLPGTNSSRFQETLDFAGRVSGYVDAFTSSSFQLFEGTPFFRNRESLGIELIERELLVKIEGREIHSCRWEYRTASSSGEEPFLNQSEIRQWKQWKSWVRGGDTFRETLGSEHYLLYCTHETDNIKNHPERPTTPLSPKPILPKTG